MHHTPKVKNAKLLSAAESIVQTDEWPDEFDSKIICPVCQYEYVHPVSVTVNQGGTITHVDGRHTVTHDRGETGQRGTIITQRFICEGDHHFEIVHRFHKGETFCCTRRLQDKDPSRPWSAMWRD